MGLDRKFLEALCEFGRSGLVKSGQRVIEIGAQQLADPFLEARELIENAYRIFGAEPQELGTPKGNSNLAYTAPSSRKFWESIGFTYAAIEFDGHRNSISLDLNREAVTQELSGKFDIVVNGGTTEHVVNQDNAFRVIHDLTKAGGVMYHDVPVCLFGHGLINYSPKFFLQLFRMNDYEPLFIRVQAWQHAEIPRYVQAMNRKWGDGNVFSFDGVKEMTISAAFRKTRDQPFATPLDLPRSLMMKQYLRSPRKWKHLLPLR
jgi:SAM-dependent methyltransferase